MINTRAVIARMKELGIMQKMIASLWDCAQSTVSLKLGNKRPIMLDEAIKLQEALHISYEEFCFYFLSPKVA